MRYGVVSDLHANLPALEAVLDALTAERVDAVVCAGDVVGYGPHPNECVARLAAEGIPAVAGNHDLIAIGRLGYERTDGLARRTLEWTRGAIGDDARAYLERLPPLWSDGALLMAHGSVADPEVYVRTEDEAAQQLATLDGEQRILVLGHTHVPQRYRDANGRLLLNPGSVGQARERRRLARFAILDTENGEAIPRAIRYDDARTRRALVAAGLPPSAHHRKRTLRDRAAGVKAAARRRISG
jgi:putative phosphoesterase